MLRQLIKLIETKHVSSSTGPEGHRPPVDFGRAVMFFSLDVIGEISFSKAFGYVEQGKDLYNFLEINDSFFPILAVALTIPWLDRYLKSWPLRAAMPKEGDINGFGKLMGSVCFFFFTPNIPLSPLTPLLRLLTGP